MNHVGKYVSFQLFVSMNTLFLELKDESNSTQPLRELNKKRQNIVMQSLTNSVVGSVHLVFQLGNKLLITGQHICTVLN